MKILLIGKNSKDLVPLVKNLSLEMVTSNPDVVISYGGDGTLLYSEKIYPGIPKLPIRDSLVCKKCPDHDEKFLLTKLLEGKLKLQEFKKLETTIFYKTLTALNDFVIRNASPIHAIRFQVTFPAAPNKLYIGDGIVLSTPYGSTGYFKSVTGQTLETGWGLAFNNTTEQIPPVLLKEEDPITFKLLRGNATLSFDNNNDLLTVDEGSELIFNLSDKVAKIYEAESLRCPACKVTRG